MYSTCLYSNGQCTVHVYSNGQCTVHVLFTLLLFVTFMEVIYDNHDVISSLQEELCSIDKLNDIFGTSDHQFAMLVSDISTVCDSFTSYSTFLPGYNNY